jgi:hypothetical protein
MALWATTMHENSIFVLNNSLIKNQSSNKYLKDCLMSYQLAIQQLREALRSPPSVVHYEEDQHSHEYITRDVWRWFKVNSSFHNPTTKFVCSLPTAANQIRP